MKNTPHQIGQATKLGNRFLTCVLMFAFGVCDSFAAAPANQTNSVTTHQVVKRGLTARFQFSHSSSKLQAAADQSIDAPVLVRLEKDRVDSPSSENLRADGHRYTLWFFGAVAGDYALADYVVQEDGSALTDAEGLASMNVTVVSELPPGYGTNLYEIADPSLRIRGGYRAVLAFLAMLWCAVPIVWAYRRWRNQAPVLVESVDRPTTLADRMRPLVEQAYAGTLSVDEQSRLELMLYRFWQQRVGLPESIATALPVLRHHAEAGMLLRNLEAWIHAPEDSRPNLDSETLDRLLLPYRDAEADALTLAKAVQHDDDVLMESVS